MTEGAGTGAGATEGAGAGPGAGAYDGSGTACALVAFVVAASDFDEVWGLGGTYGMAELTSVSQIVVYCVIVSTTTGIASGFGIANAPETARSRIEIRATDILT